MANTIQVMIVDDSDDTRQSLRLLLELTNDVQVVAEARDGAEALQKLAVISPDVVLMDVNMPVLDGVQATERICMQYPFVSVIVVSVQDDVEYVRRLMRAGAKDYLFKPVSAEQLAATIHEVHQSEQTRHTRNAVSVLSTQMTQQSQVVTFLSAKGGLGKTTIAVNAAVALATQGKRVALVDFDVQFSDTTLFLNASPERTVVDLVRESRDIDPDVLDRYLHEHDSGLSLLAGPRRPEEAEYLQPADVRVILQSLRKKFDFVLVDTAPLANDVFFSTLETSDQCYMVNTLNLAVLKNNRLLLDLLGELGYETQDIRQVLNRANSKNGLKAKDAEKLLKADLAWELDTDQQLVERSINEGSPFVLTDKQNHLSKQVFALTTRIDEAQADRVSRRNPLHKLFSMKR